VVLCIDDSGNREILSRLAKPVITYGFSPQATYRVVDWKAQERGGSTFSVQKGDELLGSFEIQLLGKHNTLNACAAIALASEEGIDPATIARALFAFQGVERRMQLVGNLGSTLLFDDYAHHPTETAATLKGLRDTYPDRKIVVVFQPHLFSRTRDQYEAFGEVFVEYSDALLVTDIYPARELPIEGVTGALVSESASRKGHRNAFFVGAKENAVALLQEKLPAGSVVVLMGAGSIWHLAQDLKNAFSQEVSA
jgi:UDP-N-acetylmuramate--alanine ligase